MMRARSSILMVVAVATAACSDASSSALAPESRTIAPSAKINGESVVGGVFTQTNDASANAVLAFARASDGTLAPLGSFATGGRGIGGTTDPLVSQYALVVGTNHQYLYVANAGSNDVSVFSIGNSGLTLVQRISTGGTTPVSVAAGNQFVYVLNTASSDIARFAIGGNGTLTSLGANRALGVGAGGAAAVRLSRDGHVLAVTERTSRTIDLFSVANDGSLGGAVTSASVGMTPFGFDFNNTGRLVVSEAATGAASSYAPRKSLTLEVQTGSALSFQRAPCWLIVTPNGQFAYTANAGSASLTGYNVASNGSLTLLNASGITADVGAGNTPLDLDVTRDGKFLYVLKAGAGAIGALRVATDGSLTTLGDVSVGAPRSGQQGVAAY